MVPGDSIAQLAVNSNALSLRSRTGNVCGGQEVRDYGRSLQKRLTSGTNFSLAKANAIQTIARDDLARNGHPIDEKCCTLEAAQGVQHGYVNKLLAAFETEPKLGRPSAPVADSSLLIDPLSPRELEVLGLIAQGLSNQEICERLFLALDTVKGHNRRIFDKLQVQRRTEAIARARDLGLI